MTTILIFGAAVLPDGKPSATLERRVDAAIACAKGHPEAIFIPTGGVGRFGASEASVMAGLLMESGIAGHRILLEDTGTDTLSSARALCTLLREQRSGGPIMLATSAYHIPRCLTLLYLLGVRAKPCRPPQQPAARSHWKRWYWRLREIPALPYDALLAIWMRITRRV